MLKPFCWVGLRDCEIGSSGGAVRADRKPVAGLVNAGSRRGTAGGRRGVEVVVPHGRRDRTTIGLSRCATLAALVLTFAIGSRDLADGTPTVDPSEANVATIWRTGRPVPIAALGGHARFAVPTPTRERATLVVVSARARGGDVSDPGSHPRLGTRPRRCTVPRDARASLRSRFQGSPAPRDA